MVNDLHETELNNTRSVMSVIVWFRLIDEMRLIAFAVVGNYYQKSSVDIKCYC